MVLIEAGNTSIGPLVGPLKWPEYDQKTLSAQQMNLPSPPYWNYQEMEDREDASVGLYPRNVPMQVQYH